MDHCRQGPPPGPARIETGGGIVMGARVIIQLYDVSRRKRTVTRKAGVMSGDAESVPERERGS